MAQDDAVTQDGPTCPLSEETLIEMYRGTEGAFLLPDLHETVLAVVAAERARLREEMAVGWVSDEMADRVLRAFDRACREVDAAARRA